jgi:hypothetical protein
LQSTEHLPLPAWCLSTSITSQATVNCSKGNRQQQQGTAKGPATETAVDLPAHSLNAQTNQAEVH